MEWLFNAFWAIIGVFFAYLVLTALVLVAVVLVRGGVAVPRIIKQSRCKYLRYRETAACDAICNDCGRNLGFIGDLKSSGQ